MKKMLLPCLIAIAFNVSAQNSALHSNCVTNPPDFARLSFEEADQAVKSTQDQMRLGKKICPEYIVNLVNQLRSSKLSNDNKTLALYFLGVLHPTDTNSIEFLIENIDFKATKFGLNTAPQRWGDYPAEEALTKIGKPTVNPILNYLPTETNKLRRHLMCEVLLRVEGKETAKKIVEQKLTDESDSSRQNNLELALKDLEK